MFVLFLVWETGIAVFTCARLDSSLAPSKGNCNSFTRRSIIWQKIKQNDTFFLREFVFCSFYISLCGPHPQASHDLLFSLRGYAVLVHVIFHFAQCLLKAEKRQVSSWVWNCTKDLKTTKMTNGEVHSRRPHGASSLRWVTCVLFSAWTNRHRMTVVSMEQKRMSLQTRFWKHATRDHKKKHFVRNKNSSLTNRANHGFDWSFWSRPHLLLILCI